MKHRAGIFHLFFQAAIVVFLLMVVRTVFVVSYEYPEPTVTGRFFYLWKILPWGIILAVPALFFSRRISFSLKDALVLLFLAYYCFSYRHHGSFAENRLITIFLLGNLYFILRVFYSYWPGLLEVGAGLILVSGIVEAVLGLRQIYGYAYSYHSLYSVTGSFFNPGPYGGYLVFVFVTGLFYSYRKRRVWRTLRQIFRDKHPLDLTSVFDLALWCVSVLAVLLCLVIIPATMSRSAWIAVMGTLLLFYLIEARGIRQIKQLFYSNKARLIGIGVGSIALVAVISFGVYSVKKGSADSRLWNWKMTSQIIADHPLTGVGPGFYGGEYARTQADYFRKNPDSGSRWQADSPVYAFNEYMQVGAESGIIGLAILLSITVLCFRNTPNKGNGFQYGLIALLLFAISSYPFRVLPLLILLIFAFAFQDEKPLVRNKRWSQTVYSMLLSSFVCFHVLIFPRQEKLSESYKEWKSARMLYQLELYEDVVTDYGPLFDELKQEREYLFEYGRSLNQSGRYKESNRVLQLGTRISNDPMFHNIIGNNYKALGNFEVADQAYDEAFHILPNRIYPLYLQTLLSLEREDTLQGLERARRTLDFEPKIESSATREMKVEVRQLIEHL